MSRVRFNYADVKATSLTSKKWVKTCVENIFESEGIALNTINYVFCSDSYLLSINEAFLQHDTYTDVITFDLSKEDFVIGEAYISLDRIRDNSKAYLTPLNEELVRVIFHAALHLCGYRDKKKSEITIMRQKEEYYLKQYREKKP